MTVARAMAAGLQAKRRGRSGGLQGADEAAHSHHTIQVVDPADWRRRRNAEASNRIPRIVFQWKFSRVGMTVERRYFAPGACAFNKSQGAPLC
jgi:hypothetical protein